VRSARRIVTRAPSQNDRVAAKLREAADILHAQRANPFRVRAYRQAADRILGLDVEVEDVLARHGLEGLLALPGIGRGIASAINELVRTGRWSQLERLRGALEPERLFESIPGVGPTFARRIHEKLEIDALEALEAAAHDGRLASVPGIGSRRTAMIRAELATLLGRRWSRTISEPSVDTLLDVDEEYRRRAKTNRLTRIAPHRFNAAGTAWLPILHTERNEWRFTALFSNTANAHQLGRTHDWVVVYFHTDGELDGQRTIVTETRGPLTGRRVVRGRESECQTYYASRGAISSVGARAAVVFRTPGAAHAR
jgi:DNA polymerase (family X)